MNVLKIIILVASVIVSGCATSFKYTYDYKPKNEKLSFEVIDVRPPEEKQATLGSLYIDNDQYGIYRLGDDQIVPDRILYLSEYISERASDLLKDKIIKVSHFEIINNTHKASQRGATASLLGGLVGAVIYASTNPDANAFIQINLQLDTEGQSYSAQVDNAYTIDKMKGISKEQLAIVIRKAMDLAIDNILEHMQKHAN